MLRPLDNPQVYSSDLWDYLADMPYMPGREDRDRLVEEASQSPERAKYIRIWDYFFRPNQEDVGKPIQREIHSLQQDIQQAETDWNYKKGDFEKTTGFLSNRRKQVVEDFERQKGTIYQNVFRAIARKRGVQRFFGIVLLILGTLSIIFTILMASGCGLALNSAKVGVGVGAVTGLFCVPIGILAFGIGGWLVALSRKPVEPDAQSSANMTLLRASQGMQNQLSKIDQDVTRLHEQFETEEKNLEGIMLQYRQRVDLLSTHLSRLVAQIPAPVTDTQIWLWLKEDIKYLSDQAVKVSGLEGRLTVIKEAENPFCIRGPASVQKRENIPQPYLVRGSDRNKHWSARQFAVLPDKSWVDLYGVYNMQFILVAEDLLATYGTYYNFILGRQTGEQTTSQHYADVVSINTSKEYREFQLSEDKTIAVDNLPSLSITLTSSERIDVTFPDEDFFRQLRLTEFSSGQWVYDPQKPAENAIQVVKEKVYIAKKRREISE